MQKHQEWLDNRSYEQHLQCLKKIKARKNHSANGRKTVRKNQHSKFILFETGDKQNRVSNLYFINDNNQQQIAPQYQMPLLAQTERNNYENKQFLLNPKQYKNLPGEKLNCITNRFAFANTQNLLNKSKKLQHFQKAEGKQAANMSLKQQQLLWNNFLLGKRILETSPVISKRKLDLQYQKHKQLLRSRTTKKLHQNSNFRLRKLQEHNDKIYKISDDHRIQQNLHKRHMVTLIIQSIEIFKYKFSSFQNIILSMKHGKSNKFTQSSHSPENSSLQSKHKQTKQVSECIPSSLLTSYNFFFTFKKKYFDQNLPIIIEIKNVKSLNVISIGTFSFQFNNLRDIAMKQANLYNFGKLIGNVKFNAHYGKKDHFLSHIQ